MNIPLFTITYNIATEESARNGDYAESGFIVRDVSLREALEAFDNDFERNDTYIEADEYPVSYPSWFTIYDGPSGRIREDGTSETRSLHLPETLSQGSRMRIARYLGCYGIPTGSK